MTYRIMYFAPASVMLYTSFATCEIRYVRVRYLHTRLAAY